MVIYIKLYLSRKFIFIFLFLPWDNVQMCFEKVSEGHCSVEVHTDDDEPQCCAGSDQNPLLDPDLLRQEPESHKDPDDDEDREDSLLIPGCCWRRFGSQPRPSSGEDGEVSCHDTNCVHKESPRSINVSDIHFNFRSLTSACR